MSTWHVWTDSFTANTDPVTQGILLANDPGILPCMHYIPLPTGHKAKTLFLGGWKTNKTLETLVHKWTEKGRPYNLSSYLFYSSFKSTRQINACEPVTKYCRMVSVFVLMVFLLLLFCFAVVVWLCFLFCFWLDFVLTWTLNIHQWNISLIFSPFLFQDTNAIAYVYWTMTNNSNQQRFMLFLLESKLKVS